MRYRISLGIHIICHAKNLRKHRITDKVPYEVLFGQFNRVPLLQLPFEPKLLRALKTETDLERLLKANDPWTDAIKPSTESLVDLTVDQNKAKDEDEDENVVISQQFIPITALYEGNPFIPYANQTDTHTNDSNAGGFIRPKENMTTDTNTNDSQAGGFFRPKDDLSPIVINDDSLPLSLCSQPNVGPSNTSGMYDI